MDYPDYIVLMPIPYTLSTFDIQKRHTFSWAKFGKLYSILPIAVKCRKPEELKETIFNHREELREERDALGEKVNQKESGEEAMLNMLRVELKIFFLKQVLDSIMINQCTNPETKKSLARLTAEQKGNIYLSPDHVIVLHGLGPIP